MFCELRVVCASPFPRTRPPSLRRTTHHGMWQVPRHITQRTWRCRRVCSNFLRGSRGRGLAARWMIDPDRIQERDAACQRRRRVKSTLGKIQRDKCGEYGKWRTAAHRPAPCANAAITAAFISRLPLFCRRRRERAVKLRVTALVLNRLRCDDSVLPIHIQETQQEGQENKEGGERSMHWVHTDSIC